MYLKFKICAPRPANWHFLGTCQECKFLGPSLRELDVLGDGLLLLLLSRFSCVDSVRPPRRQPTRLPHPWDSPGKNIGAGCRFLLQCMKVKSESEVAPSCPTLSDPMDCSPPGSSIRGIFQARVLEWGAIAFSESWRQGRLSPCGSAVDGSP